MAQQPWHGPRSILITGASSGIGAALAHAYAAPGVTLFLGGRDGGRLETVAKACRDAGADVQARTVDVVDAEAMRGWLEEADGQAPLDLVVANAGTSAGSGGRGESEAQARRIFAVNVDGAMNTVLPLLPAMTARGRGQIALVSSLAGFRGFPGAPAYCASKAALRVWGEGLRGLLAPQGIGVSVVCPGFVRTPMSDGNPYPMPMLMEAERAAAIIVAGLARNRGRIAFPWPLTWLVQAIAALPVGLTDRAMGRLPKKPAAAE
ncbi:MAG: SDR family NAD(P)-dependent oxidoreductase [Proteobacteria bacterium]|nr:SDR family NAD(P)-dependent oxidoreductase [Pseudomonadota bacterium]